MSTDSKPTSGHRRNLGVPVVFFDTTLRDGEQSPGSSLNASEKLEIAHQLVRLGVDVIEAGLPMIEKDAEAMRLMKGELKSATLGCLVRANEGDIDDAVIPTNSLFRFSS